MYTFVPNKSFGQLLEIYTKYLEFSPINVWFSDQNSKLLEIENKIHITLVTIWCVTYKNDTIFNWT